MLILLVNVSLYWPESQPVVSVNGAMVNLYYNISLFLQHWTLSLKRSKDHKDILCVVERPDVQSYLMFETFSVELTNANIKNAKIYVSKSQIVKYLLTGKIFVNESQHKYAVR